LGRIINCIKFCGTLELPLRGHDESETSYNRGIFLDLMSELASLDSVLDENLCTAAVSKKHLKPFKRNYWTVGMKYTSKH
jgi:hypothetical protein